MKNIVVYYSDSKGYIIVPFAAMKNRGPLAAVEPAICLGASASISEMAEAIRNALVTSEVYGEIDRATHKKFSYWELAGIKSFKTFCKKNTAVEISDSGKGLNVYTLSVDNEYGMFTRAEGEDTIKKFGDCIDFNNVAAAAIEFLSGKTEKREDKEFFDFCTLGQSAVEYAEPCDDLEYCGDGGTDAYAVYREQGTENYIAFLIDNGYESFDEKSVRAVLERQFGAFDEFDYSDFHGKITITAGNKKCRIESNLYHSDDDQFELLSYLEDDSKVIPQEYAKIVDSIRVCWKQ